MFFPISDDDRHLMKPAYVSISLLVLNVALFLYQKMNPEFTMGWSVIPAEITSGTDLVGPHYIGDTVIQQEVNHVAGPTPIYVTLLSAMFMHAGWMHLGGNMLYLWIFGDNVEQRFGSRFFLFFYLTSGLLATAAQIALNPESIIPNLGASGAISGVLGAYLVLFPRNKVNAIFFFRMISVPALLVLGMWIVMQFVQGYSSFEGAGESGGVAYAAHIGGFLAGVLFALVARFVMRDEPDSGFKNHYQSDESVKRFW